MKKNFHPTKRMTLSNLETKRSFEEKFKKKLKENKEKINYKEKKNNKQGHITEKKINYEKKNIKIEKTLIGNNIMRNIRLNNSRQINNSEYIKKEKYKNDSNILNKTSNNEKNSIIKINKNYKVNEKLHSNNNNYLLKQRPKIYQNNIYGANNIINNKYMNKTIEIDKKQNEKEFDNINGENNIKINNNIVCLINPKCDNIIENFGLEMTEKQPIRKTNSSSKIFSSPNKELKILDYGEFNNNLNDVNKKGIFTGKNNWENKNNRTLNLMKENGNFIYKKSARNSSCYKRGKCLNNFGINLKNEKNEKIVINSPRLSCYQKKEGTASTYLYFYNLKDPINNEENENLNLPINEDFNRNIKKEKYYIYQSSLSNNQNQRNKINKTFINKPNDLNSIDYYNIVEDKNNNEINKINNNNIREKRTIKTSMRKRRATDSFVFNENYMKKNINEINKNNKTIVINRKNEFNNFKEYKNQCNIYLNNNSIDIQDEKFNKTSVFLYKSRKNIINTMKSKPKNSKDSKIKNREKFFYNDFKTFENYFNERNKDINIESKDITLDSSPIIFHKNTPMYTKKMNNKSKTNWNIYYRKNINDKKSDICSFKKVRTFKNEKSINSNISNYDNNSIFENNKKDDEQIDNKSCEELSEFDDSEIENMNVKVNIGNCFQKKLYNYFIRKPIKRPSYIEIIRLKRNKKEKLVNHYDSNNMKSDSEWKNIQNISDIENKTLSLKNNSKDYINFELSEMEEKNDKILQELKDEEKINKLNELSSFQKISLGAKKLNQIFEINKKVKRTRTEEKFYLGYSKLNEVIHKNNIRENDSDINNNIQINDKVYTYKIRQKNKLLEDEDNNNEKEIKIKNDSDKIKSYKIDSLSTKDNLINSDITEDSNNQKLKFNNSNKNFYLNINEEITNKNDKDKSEKLKTKKKSKSTEKRNVVKKLNNENIKIDNNIKDIMIKDLDNYLKYLEKEKIKIKEDIYDGMNDSYDWKIIDELITEKNIKVEDIIQIYIDICKNNKKDMNKNNIFKLNEYIKSIIEYYTNNISKNKKEIIHLNIIETFNNIDNIILNSNDNIFEILGNLLFTLLKNKLYYMKDLNNFIEKEKSTQINIAKIVKYSIIASGNFSKQYHNDFKFTKLFNNNDIFVDYVTKEIFKK